MIELGKIEIDIQLLDDSTFDVYISHEGSSGEHYENVTADQIGAFVTEDIECITKHVRERLALQGKNNIV